MSSINTNFLLAKRYASVGDIRSLENILNTTLNIHYENDGIFISAIDSKKLEVVKYLLTSNRLLDNADIHAQDDYLLKFIAYNNCDEFLHFLVTNDKIKNEIDLTKNNFSIFISACYHKSTEVLNTLINNYNEKELKGLIFVIEKSKVSNKEDVLQKIKSKMLYFNLDNSLLNKESKASTKI